MLTKHKVSCAKFLESHFDEFVKSYNVLLQSRNYVTKRQSLKVKHKKQKTKTNRRTNKQTENRSPKSVRDVVY